MAAVLAANLEDVKGLLERFQSVTLPFLVEKPNGVHEFPIVPRWGYRFSFRLRFFLVYTANSKLHCSSAVS